MIKKGINEGDTSNEESYSEMNINDKNVNNYKGYFVEEADEDEDEPKYYEHGAHFPYHFLYQKLEILFLEQNRNAEHSNGDNRANSTESICKTQKHLNKDKNNSAFNYLNQNQRSRNQNINSNTKNKGQSVYPIHNMNIDQNPNEIIDKAISPEVIQPINLNDKNSVSQYNTFGSKLKMNMNINFYNKTNSKDNKPITKKPIQINNAPKQTTFNKSNTKDNKSKIREFSASFYKNHPNITHTKELRENDNKKNNINGNTRSLPKAFNNIVISYTNKKNNIGSPRYEADNTKQLSKKTKKTQTKKINRGEQGDNLGMVPCSVSNEKNSFNSKNKKSPLNKTLQSCSTSSNKRNKQITLPKSIEKIFSSKAAVFNRQSRNIPIDANTLSKSKTNKSECESNLTQSNINNNLLTQTKTVNLDLLKKTQTNLSQRKRPSNQTKQLTKKYSANNKLTTYLDIKLNLNPNKPNQITSFKKQKTTGIKSFLPSNLNLDDQIKLSNIKKITRNQNNFNRTKVINNKDNLKPNSPSKGSDKCHGSTSTTTTHQLSSTTVPKNITITNSKTNLGQNEHNEYINNDNQRKKSNSKK